MSKKTKIFLRVIAVLLCLALLAGGVVYYMLYAGKKELMDYKHININPGDIATAYDNGKTIIYNGKTYILNENIVSAALLGVDKEELGLENNTVGTGGQADVIVVAAYDSVTGKTSFISVPRDCITDINIYDAAGEFAGIEKKQICLAFAYGDGQKISCENVTRSVNRLLFGIPVNKYAALDLQGMPVLNDAVGGVTLKPLDTFDVFEKDKETTLMGDTALWYVRARDVSKLDSDSTRRERQIQYLKAFSAKAVSLIRSDFTVVGNLYNTAGEYSYTNISLSDAAYIASTVLNNHISFSDFSTVPGEYVQEGDYASYKIDKTALFELILAVYYNEKVA